MYIIRYTRAVLLIAMCIYYSINLCIMHARMCKYYVHATHAYSAQGLHSYNEYFSLFSIGDKIKEGDIRLVGSGNPWEGRVEIFLSGVWGSVSDDGAGTTDARVICRQLGYSSYSKV